MLTSRNNGLLFTMALWLTACASSYPPLISVQAVPPAASSSTPELDQTLAEAARLQATYATNYRQTAQLQDLGQLPIIAAAAAAAWILLDNGMDAARDVGRIGIGAGAYSTARGQLSSPGLTDAYVAGHGALTCVLAEGSLFSGEVAQTRYQQLDRRLQEVATAINDLAIAAAREPANAGAQADALKTARNLAAQSITNARTAEAAALNQQAAFLGAPPIFRNAVASISVRVASRGRVRPAIDFATLRDSFAPPKPPEGGEAQSLSEVNSIINDIIAKTNGLVGATARLSAGAPPYSQSLVRVAACPDQIR